MKRGEEPEWIEVARAGRDDRAALIAGMLEAEGIPSQIEGPSMTPLPENLGSFGDSRVLVPPDRAAEARALIARHEKEDAARRAGQGDLGDESE